MTVLRWLNRHIGVGIVLTLLLPFAVVAASVWVAQAVTRLPADAALRVHGVVVSKSELDQRVRVLGALYGLRAPSDPGQLDSFRRATARAVVTQMVLDRAIAEHHLAVPDQRAHELLADFIARGTDPPGQAAFVRLLRDTGASEVDVVHELTRREAAAKLVREVTEPAVAQVTEDTVRGYYDQHRADVDEPERRHLRNIVVTRQDQADALLTELRAGADFAQIAERSSLDRGTRDTGGDLGMLAADQLRAEYAHAAFAAPANSVFGPVRTPDGWNIGQVLEVEPATPLGFDQVHDRLTAQLRAQLAGEAWQAWLQARIAAADVEFAEEYRPLPGAAPDPPAGPGVPDPAAVPGVPGPPAPVGGPVK